MACAVASDACAVSPGIVHSPSEIMREGVPRPSTATSIARSEGGGLGGGVGVVELGVGR